MRDAAALGATIHFYYEVVKVTKITHVSDYVSIAQIG
jgi:hypothetical protein